MGNGPSQDYEPDLNDDININEAAEEFLTTNLNEESDDPIKKNMQAKAVYLHHFGQRQHLEQNRKKPNSLSNELDSVDDNDYNNDVKDDRNIITDKEAKSTIDRELNNQLCMKVPQKDVTKNDNLIVVEKNKSNARNIYEVDANNNAVNLLSMDACEANGKLSNHNKGPVNMNELNRCKADGVPLNRNIGWTFVSKNQDDDNNDADDIDWYPNDLSKTELGLMRKCQIARKNATKEEIISNNEGLKMTGQKYPDLEHKACSQRDTNKGSVKSLDSHCNIDHSYDSNIGTECSRGNTMKQNGTSKSNNKVDKIQLKDAKNKSLKDRTIVEAKEEADQAKSERKRQDKCIKVSSNTKRVDVTNTNRPGNATDGSNTVFTGTTPKMAAKIKCASPKVAALSPTKMTKELCSPLAAPPGLYKSLTASEPPGIYKPLGTSPAQSLPPPPGLSFEPNDTNSAFMREARHPSSRQSSVDLNMNIPAIPIPTLLPMTESQSLQEQSKQKQKPVQSFSSGGVIGPTSISNNQLHPLLMTLPDGASTVDSLKVRSSKTDEPFHLSNTETMLEQDRVDLQQDHNNIILNNVGELGTSITKSSLDTCVKTPEVNTWSEPVATMFFDKNNNGPIHKSNMQEQQFEGKVKRSLNFASEKDESVIPSKPIDQKKTNGQDNDQLIEKMTKYIETDKEELEESMIVDATKVDAKQDKVNVTSIEILETHKSLSKGSNKKKNKKSRKCLTSEETKTKEGMKGLLTTDSSSLDEWPELPKPTPTKLVEMPENKSKLLGLKSIANDMLQGLPSASYREIEDDFMSVHVTTQAVETIWTITTTTVSTMKCSPTVTNNQTSTKVAMNRTTINDLNKVNGSINFVHCRNNMPVTSMAKIKSKTTVVSSNACKIDPKIVPVPRAEKTQVSKTYIPPLCAPNIVNQTATTGISSVVGEKLHLSVRNPGTLSAGPRFPPPQKSGIPADVKAQDEPKQEEPVKTVTKTVKQKENLNKDETEKCLAEEVYKFVQDNGGNVAVGAISSDKNIKTSKTAFEKKFKVKLKWINFLERFEDKFTVASNKVIAKSKKSDVKGKGTPTKSKKNNENVDSSLTSVFNSNDPSGLGTTKVEVNKKNKSASNKTTSLKLVNPVILETRKDQLLNCVTALEEVNKSLNVCIDQFIECKLPNEYKIQQMKYFMFMTDMMTSIVEADLHCTNIYIISCMLVFVSANFYRKLVLSKVKCACPIPREILDDVFKTSSGSWQDNIIEEVSFTEIEFKKTKLKILKRSVKLTRELLQDTHKNLLRVCKMVQNNDSFVDIIIDIMKYIGHLSAEHEYQINTLIALVEMFMKYAWTWNTLDQEELQTLKTAVLDLCWDFMVTVQERVKAKCKELHAPHFYCRFCHIIKGSLFKPKPKWAIDALKITENLFENNAKSKTTMEEENLLPPAMDNIVNIGMKKMEKVLKKHKAKKETAKVNDEKRKSSKCDDIDKESCESASSENSNADDNTFEQTEQIPSQAKTLTPAVTTVYSTTGRKINVKPFTASKTTPKANQAASDKPMTSITTITKTKKKACATIDVKKMPAAGQTAIESNKSNFSKQGGNTLLTYKDETVKTPIERQKKPPVDNKTKPNITKTGTTSQTIAIVKTNSAKTKSANKSGSKTDIASNICTEEDTRRDLHIKNKKLNANSPIASKIPTCKAPLKNEAKTNAAANQTVQINSDKTTVEENCTASTVNDIAKFRKRLKAIIEKEPDVPTQDGVEFRKVVTSELLDTLDNVSTGSTESSGSADSNGPVSRLRKMLNKLKPAKKNSKVNKGSPSKQTEFTFDMKPFDDSPSKISQKSNNVFVFKGNDSSTSLAKSSIKKGNKVSCPPDHETPIVDFTTVSTSTQTSEATDTKDTSSQYDIQALRSSSTQTQHRNIYRHMVTQTHNKLNLKDTSCQATTKAKDKGIQMMYTMRDASQQANASLPELVHQMSQTTLKTKAKQVQVKIHPHMRHCSVGTDPVTPTHEKALTCTQGVQCCVSMSDGASQVQLTATVCEGVQTSTNRGDMGVQAVADTVKYRDKQVQVCDESHMNQQAARVNPDLKQTTYMDISRQPTAPRECGDSPMVHIPHSSSQNLKHMTYPWSQPTMEDMITVEHLKENILKLCDVKHLPVVTVTTDVIMGVCNAIVWLSGKPISQHIGANVESAKIAVLQDTLQWMHDVFGSDY
ncbi:unnamed protein product [Owenia fusiformis]|uniref:Uncharacterized protein n=1 Tax=Owenia fusiformis TaxID=6347 RepID=A0A8J1U053_OWEFU|nr:unnamed protein product [Owenia fusiformis]